MIRISDVLKTLCILIVPLLAIDCEKSKTITIRIFGSTTIEPFIKKAVREYDKKGRIDFRIIANGSKAGIDSLIAGTCDIAMSSMEPLPEQSLAATKKGMTLKPFLLGYDVIIPIVHPTSNVSDISFSNLQEVFSGTKQNWLSLGGADTVIDIVDRTGSSGTFRFWHHAVACSLTSNSHISVEQTNSTVLAHVSKSTNAIGYVSNAFLNPEVKPLRLDGIDITQSDSIVSKYHLKRPLYLYVNVEKFENEVKSFIVFLIINNRGKDLLRESGFFFVSNTEQTANK